MYAQRVRRRDNKCRKVVKSISQQRSGGRQGFGFVEKRPQGRRQVMIKEAINDSHRLDSKLPFVEEWARRELPFEHLNILPGQFMLLNEPEAVEQGGLQTEIRGEGLTKVNSARCSTVVQRDADQDLAKIQELMQDQRVPLYLRNILREIYGKSQTSLGRQKPGVVGAYPHAGRRFDAAHTLTRQEVLYMGNMREERERIGNLVHELTHVSVQDAFARDYVNYTNPSTRLVPAEIYNVLSSGETTLANEEERQGARMVGVVNEELQVRLADLQRAADADRSLTGAQRQAIKEKLLYGFTKPHLEYDTVINQIAVWLHYWGVGSPASSFALELERLAQRNRIERYAQARDVIGGRALTDDDLRIWSRSV